MREIMLFVTLFMLVIGAALAVAFAGISALILWTAPLALKILIGLLLFWAVMVGALTGADRWMT